MNFKNKISKLHYQKDITPNFLTRLLDFGVIFYGLGSLLKNLVYDKGIIEPEKVNAYIISVGNLTTGGVGKTPVVCEIAKHFAAKYEAQYGLETYPRVAIISRGYRGKLSNKNINIISDGINLYHKADMAGDEPFWLAVNCNMCAVITCKDRVKAAEYAIEKMGIETIILDDGFQHRKIHRDLDIVLMDSEKGFGNEKLLPAGPLREGIEAFNRVNKLVVVSKNVEHSRAEKLAKIMEKKLKLKTQVCYTEPDYVYNIKTGEHLEKGATATAMCAIGQPEQFYKFLNEYNITATVDFDDHHQYCENDLDGIDGNIITTEKDAVKLSLLQRDNIFALKLKTRVNVEELLNG